MTVEASARGKRNRRYGHDTERMVVQYLREHGFPDACTTRAKLGHDGATAPGDIDAHPCLVLEVKGWKNSVWPTWCRQAAAEAGVGQVPVVVRRTRGIPRVGEWPCRVDGLAWQDLTGRHPLDGHPVAVHEVDGRPWLPMTFAAMADAVRLIDRSDS